MIYSPIKCLLSAAWSAAAAVAVVPRCSRGPCLSRIIRQPQQQQLSSAIAAAAAGRLVATWAAHNSSVVSSRSVSLLSQWSLEPCTSSTLLLDQSHFFLLQQSSRVTAAAAQAALTFVAHSSSSAGTNDSDSISPKQPQQQHPHKFTNKAGNNCPSSPAGSQPQQDSSSSKRPRGGSSNDSTAAHGTHHNAVGCRKQGAGDNKQQRSSSSGRNSQQISPQLLTARLKGAQTPEQLTQLLQRHAGDLNHIHLSAAFTRAKALRTDGVPPQQLSELLSQLHCLAQRLQLLCEARQLANIIWSCAYLGGRDTAAELLPVFLQSDKLQAADPQEVSNVLWAAATLQLQLTDEQLQQMLQHFSSRQVLQQAKPQAVSNTLWAVATMQQQVPPQQLQQLLQCVQQLLPQARPQDVSNTLWAVATMQQQVPQQQLQQMLQRLQQLLPQANSQDVSNTLWAVATMQQQVPQQLLQQLLDRFQELLSTANPQNVANTLSACGKLQFMPLQLLSALEQQPQQLQKFLAAAKPQELANTAWACGQLGYSSKQLPGALMQQVVRLLPSRGGVGSFTAQNLCNLCWSAAVLDVQQCVPLVLQLAGAASQVWGGVVDKDLQQLSQMHFLWLLDSGLPAPGQGLSGVLSQQQLEQCRGSWEQDLAAETALSKTSDFQRGVFAAAQQLPADLWQEPPALEQVTADGVFSIDIAATTAAGVRVAIEADGPSHFIRPGNTLEGGTKCRNRALAARGYAVLSIPYWEWQQLRGADSKQQYLLAKLQAAAQPTQAQHAGSTAGAV